MKPKSFLCQLLSFNLASLLLGRGLAQGTGTSLLLLVIGAELSGFCMVFPLSLGNLLENTQLDSFIADLEMSRDVVCLVQCLRLIGESISMEMAFIMEMACSRLQPPEKAAEQILEDLIANDT